MNDFTNNTTERFTLSEKDLFERLVKLETDKLVLADDIKQLKSDSTYHEDANPKGISKEDIKLIAKASVLHAKATFEEQQEAATAVFSKYKELVDY